MNATFIPGEAIKFGWEKMKKHFWFFVGLLALTCLIQIIPSGIANIFKERMFALYLLIILAAWVIQIIVKMGLIKITLDVTTKDETNLNTLFSCTHLLGKFIIGSIVYGLIVIAGFLLLIVPGIIWAIKYQFFAYLIIDKNMAPMEAIRKSGEMTAGNKGKLFWLGILFFLINLVGALCLFLGLFATIPTTMVAMAYVYRKLLGESNAPGAVPPVESITLDQPAV
ncbi:MAG: hypothetical protein WC022_03300 [Parcubacteria group bacterium]